MRTIPYSPERSRNEAADLLREIAGDSSRSVKQALNRASARIAPHLKLSYGRLRHIWYGDARLLRAEETDALRAAAAERRQKIEAGRAATKDIVRVHREAAARLRAIDPVEFRDQIAVLERNAVALGPLDRAGAASSRVSPPASGNGGGE